MTLEGLRILDIVIVNILFVVEVNVSTPVVLLKFGASIYATLTSGFSYLIVWLVGIFIVN